MKALYTILLITISLSLIGKQTIVLGYENAPVRPYALGDSNEVPEENPGITVELLQKVAENLNITFDFKRLPWKRCLSNMSTGELDGVFQASYKEERELLGNYPMKGDKLDRSRALTTMSYNLYKLKDSNIYWDGEILNTQNRPIGAVLGYSIVGDLKKMGVAVDEGKAAVNNLMKVSLGRIPATCELSTEADKILNEKDDQFKDIIKVEPPIKVKPYYLMLSHKFVLNNPELAEKIWDEIAKVRNSSFYKELKKRYGF